MNKNLKTLLVASLIALPIGAFAAVPTGISVNINNVTVDSTVPYLAYKYNFDSSCTNVSDGYYCGDSKSMSLIMSSEKFNQNKSVFMPVMQNLQIVSNANLFAGGVAPYVDFGYSLDGNTAVFPASCAVPMQQSGNYNVTVSETGCVISK